MKPYVKYGKLYLIFSALFAAIILPLDSILQVYFPQAVLNLLSSHKGFSVIVWTAIGFECALLLITLLDDLFHNAYAESVGVRIRANINREIYEQCCKTKYAYVDDPEYYDKFSWAIKEYANKSADAVEFLVSTLTLVITVASLITIIENLMITGSNYRAAKRRRSPLQGRQRKNSPCLCWMNRHRHWIPLRNII